MSIKKAAAESRRVLLEALRDKIAGEIDAGVPAHTLPHLVRQLREITEEIEELDSREGGDDIGQAASTPDAVFNPDAL